jgi:hypothetical protein
MAEIDRPTVRQSIVSAAAVQAQRQAMFLPEHQELLLRPVFNQSAMYRLQIPSGSRSHRGTVPR